MKESKAKARAGLTPVGRKRLGVEASTFSQMFDAILRVMRTT